MINECWQLQLEDPVSTVWIALALRSIKYAIRILQYYLDLAI